MLLLTLTGLQILLNSAQTILAVSLYAERINLTNRQKMFPLHLMSQLDLGSNTGEGNVSSLK